MTKMYDKDFDPLTVLQDLQGQLLQCSKNINQLATAFNQNRELQQQMVNQMNQMIEAINQHDTSLYDLHDRVRLLEAARQYENTNQTIHTFGTTPREIDN
jgi:methyl-accepting chemotaxis protein